ncbi:MAG TPA: hypothetical protein VK027_09930 [Chitinophagaceae bacterium]|nr:hypothetical protein [Chitinophagaceae bacterium]
MDKNISPKNRIQYSIIFAIVVLGLMTIVDYFLTDTNKTLLASGNHTMFIAKKVLDLVMGFAIGYFVLFKPKN